MVMPEAVRRGEVAYTVRLDPADAGLRLLNHRPLAHDAQPVESPAQAREALQAVAAQAAGALDRAGGIPLATIDHLRQGVAQLTGLSDHAALQAPQIKIATQALSQMSVATQLLEPSLAHQLSPNDFAKMLVAHASAMEKQARAMSADPSLAPSADHLHDAARALRVTVQENYFASGHIEAYSVKEAANFRALSQEAGCDVLESVIDTLKDSLQTPGLSPEQAHKIEKQIDGIRKYQTELRDQADHFRSEQYQDNADKTADRRQIKRMMGGTLHKFQLKKALHFVGLIGVKLRKDSLVRAGRSGQPLPQRLGDVHIKTAMAAHMRGRLQALGLPASDVPSLGKLREQLGDAYKNGVQQQPWRNIARSHAMIGTDPMGHPVQLSFENQITRARDISAELKASYGQDGLEGVSSLANKEARHVVNMWHTEYRPTGGGGFQFSGLRHGIHDAYKIKDPQARQAANDARVEEFIKASIATANPASFTPNSDGTLSLSIVSMSLVTPAAVGGDEKEMLANQVAAYQRANERFGSAGIEVRLPQPDGSFRTERVKPNIIAFNAGVNSFSLGKTASTFGGWGPSDRLNNESIRQLVGDGAGTGALGGLAARKIETLRAELADPSKADQHLHIRRQIGVIQTLASQVQQMLRDQSHHSAGFEPYKFPVRILALANECGAASAFNCKSGKDRTGQLDVEIKDFYTHLNVAGEARVLNHQRSQTENLNLKTLFEQGGGREIQKYNTGIPGSKVDLKVFYDVFQFTNDKIDDLKGLSKWVGS